MVKKNIFSIFIALIILYLSLAGSDTFDGAPFLNIPHFDKIAHLGMYFGFKTVIMLENKNKLINILSVFYVALIPFFYGILMELLQLFFTNTRSGSVFDAVFNTIGILFAIILWIMIKPHIKILSNRN